MFWYEALILGLVQGLTEFLPVSSSGHLVLFPQIFGFEPQPLVFDVVLHLGTALALFVYFWRDLVKTVGGFLSDFVLYRFKFANYCDDARLGGYILIGSVPAAIFGVLLESYIEDTFRSLLSVALFLFLGSFLLMFAEVRGSKQARSLDENFLNDVANTRSTNSILSPLKALGIGVFQTFALFPGVSRSGATISGGMFFGLNRADSARFSFLLSIPIILGAGLFKIVETFSTDLASVGILPLVLGFFASFLVGIFAIDFLLKFVKTHSLYVFVVYRVLLAAVLLFVFVV